MQDKLLIPNLALYMKLKVKRQQKKQEVKGLTLTLFLLSEIMHQTKGNTRMPRKRRDNPDPNLDTRSPGKKRAAPLEENGGEKVPIVTHEKFTKGMLVEVCSDEDGFLGAWFAATIVEAVGNDKFLIEYQSLRTEDNSAFLREEIDTLHIRPNPPETAVEHFSLLQEVDALYNDGWWVGVISKVLSGSRYIVYFRSTYEEIEFQQSELRLHQDWIGGKWVMPSRA